MLLQAPGDVLENSDETSFPCPSSLSMSIAIGAALSLMSPGEYCRIAVIEKLMADGLAVDVTSANSPQVQ